MYSHLSLFNFCVIFAITIGVHLQNSPKHHADLANAELMDAYNRVNNQRQAKNIIIFVGGGMGLSTITAARILKGQLNNGSGEEAELVFENFPNTCLLKTYSVDHQVPDSAATATALLSGVKTNNGVMGVNARVKKGESNCETVQNNIITNIFDLAFDAGMRTGIVSNTRITGSTAAGAYASIAHEDWEGHIPAKFAHHPTHEDCKDIGRQLVENHPGRNLNVILGGGGRYLHAKNHTDPATGRAGQREDGLNMVQKWQDQRKETGISQEKYKVLLNRDQLLKTYDDKNLEYIFGIFTENHMSYDKERDHQKEPSLEEMTVAAIKVLNKNEKGFLLVVESGLIDVAHHENYANLALYETLALERTVNRTRQMVSTDDDTLIIVTSDHGQSLTMNGYQPRGENIMGVAGRDDETRKAFTTLLYTNGPGHKKNRTDASKVDTSAPRYQNYAGVYLASSAHTGEDVALYAIGPMSHLFHGIKEQTFVSHAMIFAACFGHYQHYDHCTAAKSIRYSAPIAKAVTSSAFTSENTPICLFLALNISMLLFQLIKL